MKKILIGALMALASVSAANAQFTESLNRLGIFNHVGVSVNAGTTGIGFDVSSPITSWVQMRLGADFMPGINFNTDVTADINDPFTAGGVYRTEMNVKASLARTQGHILFNFYPLRDKAALFIAAGAYFGGPDLVKVEGRTDDPNALALVNAHGGSVMIGDYALPMNPDGSVNGALRTSSFRPYLGIGWGRPCPGKRISFMCELGVQFMKKLKVVDSLNQEVPLGQVSDDDDFQKIIDKITVYPVLKFSLNGRIF